jgi:hypothetical protein
MGTLILATVVSISYFMGCYIGHKLFVRKFKKHLTNIL